MKIVQSRTLIRIASNGKQQPNLGVSSQINMKPRRKSEKREGGVIRNEGGKFKLEGEERSVERGFFSPINTSMRAVRSCSFLTAGGGQ